MVDGALLVSAALIADSQNTGSLGLIPALACLFHSGAWARNRLISSLLLAALLFPILDTMVKRGVRSAVRDQVSASTQILEPLVKGTRVSAPTDAGARLMMRLIDEQREHVRQAQGDGFYLSHDPTTTATAAQLARLMKILEAAKRFDALGLGEDAGQTVSLMFSDPFARLLGLTPARGSKLVLAIERTAPYFTPEQAHDYLKTADSVFVERCHLTSQSVNQFFDPVLDIAFARQPLTDCFDLYRRK